MPATLPDHYPSVAEDVIAFCGEQGGRVWVDLGAGPGGLGLAVLERLGEATMVLVDPDAKALQRALAAAQARGLVARTVAILAPAESIPLPAASVDVVISRGSFYFWADRAQGLREIWRILRPGGRAMIGGGLGSAYPQWARQEFIRRRRPSMHSPEEARAFAEARSPATFRRLAIEAGLPAFEVVGEGGLAADDPKTGFGIWLRCTKESAHDASLIGGSAPSRRPSHTPTASVGSCSLREHFWRRFAHFPPKTDPRSAGFALGRARLAVPGSGTDSTSEGPVTHDA